MDKVQSNFEISNHKLIQKYLHLDVCVLIAEVMFLLQFDNLKMC